MHSIEYKNIDIFFGINIHYKRCEITYNERLKELVDNGQVSLRGLKDNTKIYDKRVFDINSNYFEKHEGYKFIFQVP